MKTFLIIGIVLVVAIGWTVEKITAANLHVQIDALHQKNLELVSLQNERERLQRLLPGPDELTRLQRAAAERDRVKDELAIREEGARPNRPLALTVGEWLPSASWKNRGQATPAAAVETALWAAAGGEVLNLKHMLQLDDAVRAKAQEILARLPGSSRALYASPEDLIAAFTTKAVPLGEAQMIWQNQYGPDDAVVCVFIKNPEPGATSPSPPAQGPLEKMPPMGPPNSKINSTYLSLHRTADAGWHLVVPMSAVEKIAKELAGAKVP